MAGPELAKQLAGALGYDLSDDEARTVSNELDQWYAARRQERPDGSDATIEQAIARAGKGPYSVEATTESVRIGGTAAPEFGAVREAFVANFSRGLERNAQLCVYQHGKCVVDLWGENQEPDMSTAPASGYDGDTLQSVYSSGKAIESTVFAMAVDRGLCSYDDLVSQHWPEFAANGKAQMTIADVLRHDAGLHAFDEALTPDDIRDQANQDGNMSRIIASQAPWTWPSGPYQGRTPRIYHAVSRGYVLSQILIRVDPAGRTIGQWMAEELCGPLGADFYCGSHDNDYASGNRPQADMHFRTGPDRAYQFAHGVATGIIRRVLGERLDPTPMEVAQREFAADPLFAISPEQNPQGRLTGGRPSPMGFDIDPGDSNSHALEITSSSSSASARGMARVMGMLANGGILDNVRILNADGIDVATSNAVSGADRPNGRFGMAASNFVQGGWGVVARGTFGWGGAGGSVIQFSPERGIGLGYTCTGFAGGLSGDQDRVGPIGKALYEATR
ncbi:MAG: serine hydrolase [Proteobacteria bacterium]|jgi:CubicO group peptidase (beta-lactamase class C family)|nr:serine hydrolase [Pseudomonadota bacterium]